MNCTLPGSCRSVMAAVGAMAVERKPNVGFILADDLGRSDTTLYGTTTYQTPHVARLVITSFVKSVS